MFDYRMMWPPWILLCVCFLTISKCQDWTIEEESCRTPDGKEGDCIPVMQCEPITHFIKTAKRPLTQEAVRYLNSYTCSYESNKVWVCCPPGPISSGEQESAATSPPDVTRHRNYHLLPEDCGYLDPNDRVLGGENAGLNEFPWMALLSYLTKTGPVFKCGGTIINEKYILTAAHCLHESKNPLLGVRVGEHNIRTKPVDCELIRNTTRRCTKPVQDLAIEEILVHPGYNRTIIQNDIGLLRVSKMNLNVENARPVCLPVDSARGLNVDGKNVVVTGWGVDDTGHSSAILQRVYLPIVSLADCKHIYKNQEKVKLTERQICAGGKDRKDSCPGDSGGPMLIDGFINGESRYVQEGIVSFGPAICGLEGFPGVYTRVDYYMDWLLDVMKP